MAKERFWRSRVAEASIKPKIAADERQISEKIVT